eukprot:12426763-Karenia_brevis.AAC.1
MRADTTALQQIPFKTLTEVRQGGRQASALAPANHLPGLHLRPLWQPVQPRAAWQARASPTSDTIRLTLHRVAPHEEDLLLSLSLSRAQWLGP